MRLLSLSLIAAVLSATIGLGWLLDVLFLQMDDKSNRLSHDNVEQLESISKDIAQSLNAANSPNEFIEHWPQHSLYQLKLLAFKELQLPLPLQQQLTGGQPLVLSNNNGISIYYFLPRHQSLLLMQPKIAVDSGDHSVRWALTLLFYVALMLLLWAWSYPLISRLLNLRIVAQRFGKGDLQQRIKVGNVSYVKDLELEFNHMAQRIENLVADVKLIGSAVSHDLRTPLARMRFGIDTIIDEPDQKKCADYLVRLGHDVDEMTQLVEILLDYARIDQSMLQLTRSQLDVIAVIEKCRRNKQAQCQQWQINTPAIPFWIEGDPKYLAILFNNVLQNAIQYHQQCIRIDVLATDQVITISVADDGQGFNGNIDDMLKPFVRGKDPKTKGYGMGLAIVKRIVEWHQGQLILGQCDTLGGAQVIITLPLYSHPKSEPIINI